MRKKPCSPERERVNIIKIKQTSNQTKVEVFRLTPVGTPTVSADPVVNAVLSTPTVQLDSMVGSAGTAGIVHVDTTSVLLNTVSIDVSTDWTTGIDLSHDSIITSNTAVFTDGDLWVVGDWV